MLNYYQALGISPNATAEQIKAAYREFAKHFHPDKHTNSEFFKLRFQEVQRAYETLSDSTLRADYDKQVNKSTGGKSTYDSTIRELNLRIKNLDAELLSKDTILKRTAAEAKISATEATESAKLAAELVVQVDSLKLQLSKNVNRENNPSKSRIFLNNLKYVLRPPISYALVLVVLIIGIASFVNALPDKRIDLAKAFKSYREHDEKDDHAFILHNADSLLKTNAAINLSNEAVKWRNRTLERADLLVARGIAKARMKNDTGAMRDFTVSMRYYSKNAAYPLAHRADLKLELGDTIGSLDDATRAIMIENRDRSSRYTRGGIYFAQRKYRLALVDFKVAHNSNAQDEVALYNMGLCYSNLNKPDSACIMWRKAGEFGSKDALESVKNLCR